MVKIVDKERSKHFCVQRSTWHNDQTFYKKIRFTILLRTIAQDWDPARPPLPEAVDILVKLIDLGKPQKKVVLLMARPLRSYPPPLSNLMDVGKLERWKKKFEKSFFSLMARPLREELFLRLPLSTYQLSCKTA